MVAAPPITVVTTTYNWPDALRVAIRSALAQTLTDFEYLVVGDACTDHSADLVESFDDPRIRWINLAENRGNQADVNRIALEQARGEHIAYLNHDDIWFPEHLKTLYEAMTDKRLDVVSSLALSIAPPGQHHREIIGLPSLREKRRLGVNPMTTNVMHRADAARQCGGWENWRETEKMPTQDFFRRLRALRRRYAVVPLITSLKFHSGDRRNSYRHRSASEQQDW
jgi:glycosyltransferase involved in cell wall biosynthesis